MNKIRFVALATNWFYFTYWEIKTINELKLKLK